MEGRGRGHFGVPSRHLPEGLKINKKSVRLTSLGARDLNPRLLKYEGLVHTRPRRLVHYHGSGIWKAAIETFFEVVTWHLSHVKETKSSV
jgi:hypothetical protein